MKAIHISEELYHKDIFPDINEINQPLLSNSIAKKLLDCPMKAWLAHPKLNTNYKSEDKDIFDFGRAVHAWLLEGKQKFVTIDADSYRTKAAQEARDVARAAGNTPILKAQVYQIKEMVSAALEFLYSSEAAPYIGDLYKEGDAELTYVWQDSGVWCKCRPDWIRNDKSLIIDYKTTNQSANPDRYIHVIESLSYDIQHSFYARGVQAVEGIDPKFIFLVQETEYPYLCSIEALDIDYINIGASKVSRAISIWKNCLKTGRWPGYSNEINIISPKPWKISEEIKINHKGEQI
jgi:hypothetical protein